MREIRKTEDAIARTVKKHLLEEERKQLLDVKKQPDKGKRDRKQDNQDENGDNRARPRESKKGEDKESSPSRPQNRNQNPAPTSRNQTGGRGR